MQEVEDEDARGSDSDVLNKTSLHNPGLGYSQASISTTPHFLQSLLHHKKILSWMLAIGIQFLMMGTAALVCHHDTQTWHVIRHLHHEVA
jgi:hypothetical protein